MLSSLPSRQADPCGSALVARRSSGPRKGGAHLGVRGRSLDSSRASGPRRANSPPPSSFAGGSPPSAAAPRSRVHAIAGDVCGSRAPILLQPLRVQPRLKRLLFGCASGAVLACATPVASDHRDVVVQPAPSPRRVCRVATPAVLFEQRLRVDAANCVELDAVFSEWPELLETTVAGGEGPGPSLGVGLATDGELLFIAARLRRSHRGEGRAAERIHLRFWFLNEATSGSPVDLWLPIPSSRRGDGSTGFTLMRVEPFSDGFNLEAAVPWKALLPSGATRWGLRANVTYSTSTEFGFSAPTGTLVPCPEEQTLLAELESDAHRLWPGATRSWLDAGGDFPVAADLVGDERFERLGRMGGRVSVCRFDGPPLVRPCRVLDFGAGTRIERIETHAVLGRGKKDLLVRYWRPTSAAQHLVLELLTPQANDEWRAVFRHELEVIMNCCGSEANAPPYVRNEVHIEPGAIEIRAGRTWRVAHDTFTEPPLGGEVYGLLLPWVDPPLRRYVVSQGRFVRDD